MNLVSVLTDPDNVLTGVVALVVFFTVITILTGKEKSGKLDSRMKSVANRREELRRRSMEALTNRQQANASLRQSDESLYKKVVERLDLSRLLEDPEVVAKLAQAGFRGPKPISTFYFFRFAAPFILGIFVLFYVNVVNDFGLTSMGKLTAFVGAMVVGYYAPNIYVSNAAQNRRDSIMRTFPDGLDLLLICVESGMSIEAALQKVAQEVGASSPELAEELSLLTAELSYLPDRRLAYDGLAKRNNHPGVRAVATALSQAERYGTQIGSALRVLAKENRELRLSQAEKTAAALPAKLTVPMILFFLPVLFVVILGPAIIRVQDILGGK